MWSPTRIRLALLALALGGFGIGCTEFVAMGLLPTIASDLLPGLYAASSEDANAQAGLLITAYALGVVVGAPTIATIAAKYSRKTVLVVMLSGIVVATFASALLPSFGLVLVARFVAALPHGAYFGIAALVAASLMGPGKRGKGVAIVMSGLTIANVIGVPAVTWLGQIAGWRISYIGVTALFVLAAIAVAFTVPALPGDRNATMRSELKAFGRAQVWFAVGMGAIGFGGLFAVYTFVAPLMTDVAGLPESVVPFGLVSVGLGMTIGNFAGGAMADGALKRWLIISMFALLVSLAGLALVAAIPVGLFLFLFLVGVSASALGPMVQTRLMDVAGDSQSLAAALMHSSFNIANGLGAALGAAVVAAGWGYVSPIYVGMALAVGGIIIAVTAFAVERRSDLRIQKSTQLSTDELVLDQKAVVAEL